jgi:Mg2+-importing ATPase
VSGGLTSQQRPDDPVLETSWGATPEALFAALGSGPGGLTADAVRRARERDGRNLLAQKGRHTDLALLWGQIANPMLLLLLGAAALSFAVGSRTDAWIILGIVFISVVIGFWQERAAAHAVEALLARVAVNAVALRDGVEIQIPVADLVPGDIVRLRAGNLIPADLILLDANALHVDEAALTGESMPTEKRAGPVPAGTPLAGRLGSVWFGTHVVSGTATALVVRTGLKTAFGAIANTLNSKPPASDFERGISAFGGLLVRTTTLLVVGIFATNLYFERNVLESFLFAVALAVGLVGSSTDPAGRISRRVRPPSSGRRSSQNSLPPCSRGSDQSGMAPTTCDAANGPCPTTECSCPWLLQSLATFQEPPVGAQLRPDGPVGRAGQPHGARAQGAPG